MFNPAVTSGVDLFVNIVIALASFAAAVSFIDMRNTNKKENKEA